MVNKVILIGNVGQDPEVRTLENGTKVARISLATTERIYNKDTQEAREHTEWHSITLWRNLAEVVEKYVKKGSRIYIEGKLQSNDWIDKDGNKRKLTVITANEIKLLDRKPEAQASPAAQSPQSTAAPVQGDSTDDLPF